MFLSKNQPKVTCILKIIKVKTTFVTSYLEHVSMNEIVSRFTIMNHDNDLVNIHKTNMSNIFPFHPSIDIFINYVRFCYVWVVYKNHM